MEVLVVDTCTVWKATGSEVWCYVVGSADKMDELTTLIDPMRD